MLEAIIRSFDDQEEDGGKEQSYAGNSGGKEEGRKQKEVKLGRGSLKKEKS